MEATLPVIEHAPIDRLSPELAARLGTERAAAWSRDREPYRPQLALLREPDGDAAAVTSGRPNTRYTKIVDLWSATDAAGERLLLALIAESADRGDACIKWEMPREASLPEFAVRLGFGELVRPIASGVGTDALRGYVLWHEAWPHPQLRYYSQTTDFTCGAVAAMTALTGLGLDPFGVADGSRLRERELAFWRQATNFPACEPVGLAVAVHDALGTASEHRVELHLDTDGPVLLEGYTGEERNYRQLLQAQSAEHARARGIERRTDRVEVAEIVRRVEAGDYAVLLIDDALMHDTSTPHWVLAHAARGDTVLLHEPWATDERGETWVDSHDLPIGAAALDRLVSWGDPGYRGVIFITR